MPTKKKSSKKKTGKEKGCPQTRAVKEPDFLGKNGDPKQGKGKRHVCAYCAKFCPNLRCTKCKACFFW
jgi:hypothetical protein